MTDHIPDTGKKVDTDLMERAERLYYSLTSRSQLVGTVARELQAVRDAEREQCAKGLERLTRSIRTAYNLNVDYTVAEIVSMIEAIRKGSAA